MKKVRLYEGFHGINEAKLSAIHKAAKKGSYPATIVAIEDDEVVHQEIVDTPQAAPAAFNVIQKQYPNARIDLESRTGEILFQEGVEVNERLSKSQAKKVSDYLMSLDAEELMVICDELLIDDEEYQDIRHDLDASDLIEYAMEYIEAEGIELKDIKSIIESVELNESLVHGFYQFSKSSQMIDNLLPEGGWLRGEVKYAVVAHNTVQMGKDIMYLKGMNSGIGKNFEAHIISIHNSEDEAFRAYIDAAKGNDDKAPSNCVSYAYGVLKSKGSGYPFDEIGGERRRLK